MALTPIFVTHYYPKCDPIDHLALQCEPCRSHSLEAARIKQALPQHRLEYRHRSLGRWRSILRLQRTAL